MSEFTDAKTAELNSEHAAPTQSQAPEATQPEASLNPRELAPGVYSSAESAAPADQDESLSFIDQKRAELAEERDDDIPEDITEQVTPEHPYHLSDDAPEVAHMVRDIVSELGVEKTEALGTAIMKSLDEQYAEQAQQLQSAAYVNQLQSALNSPELSQAYNVLQFAQSIDPSQVDANQWAGIQQQVQTAQHVLAQAEQNAQQLQIVEQQHQAAQLHATEQRMADTYGDAWNQRNKAAVGTFLTEALSIPASQVENLTDPLAIRLATELYKERNRKEWNHNADIARINADPSGDWASQPHLAAAYEKEQKRQAKRSAKAKAQSRNSSGQFESTTKAQDSWNKGTGSFQDFKRSQLAAERFKS